MSYEHVAAAAVGAAIVDSCRLSYETNHVE